MAIPPSGFAEESFSSVQDITHMPSFFIENGRPDRAKDKTTDLLGRLVKAMEKKNAEVDLSDEKISNNEKRAFEHKLLSVLEGIRDDLKKEGKEEKDHKSFLEKHLPSLKRKKSVKDAIEDEAGQLPGKRGKASKLAKGEKALEEEGKLAKGSRLARGAKGLVKAGGVLAVADAAFGLYNDKEAFTKSRGHSFLGDNTGFKNSGIYNVGRESLRGAELGAGIGSIIPGIGTMAGAGVGAAGGTAYGLYEQYQKQIDNMLKDSGHKTVEYMGQAEKYLVSRMPSWQDYADKLEKEISKGDLTKDIISKLTGFVEDSFKWVMSELPSMDTIKKDLKIAGSTALTAIEHPIQTATNIKQSGERAYDSAHYYLTGKHESFDPTILAAQAAASKATGVSRDYLDTAAQLESSGGKRGFASTSSAKGTYQFIDSTWKSMYKKYGKQYNLVDNALDPRSNAIMGALYARDNKQALAKNLGHDPSNAELYMAHFLGVGNSRSGATQLINRASNDPNADAVNLFQKQADANKAIFYNKDGSHKTVKEVYDTIQGRWDAGAKVAKKNISNSEKSMGVNDDGTRTDGKPSNIAAPLKDAKASAPPPPTPVTRDTPDKNVKSDITKPSSAGDEKVHKDLSDWVELKAKKAGASTVTQDISRGVTAAATAGYKEMGDQIAKLSDSNFVKDTVSRAADFMKKQGIELNTKSDQPQSTKPPASPNKPQMPSSVLHLNDIPMFVQDSGLVLVNMGHAS